MSRRNVDLGSGSVGKLLFSLAVPTITSQIVNMLYNLVDRVYIGHMQPVETVGKLALTGVGVCLPIIMVISAFAALMAFGGAPRASIAEGRGDLKESERIMGNSFTMLVAVSVVLTVVFLVFAEPMLRIFGASDNTIGYALNYMRIYALGTIFVQVTLGMNAFITAQGFTVVGMKTVLIGAGLNTVLDPVFIFVMNMGVRGAAIATVLSQMASCIYVLLFLFGKRPLVRITFGGYRWKTMKQVLLVGLSPFLIIASDSLLIIVMNMVISSYGGPERSDMLLTCNTIVQSFMLIITMPLGGITGGTQTVMGYNYGAGRPDRIRKAEKHILLLSVAFTTVMFIIAQAGPGYFVRIFTREMSYVRVTEWAIRIFTLCIIPLAVEYTVVDGFTGMGIAKVAISLSMFRKSVYFLGMILLPRYFGVEAVFYAEPISDIMACAAASTTFIMLSGKVLKDNRRLF